MSTPAIALTIGDPNGIGPEIAVKAAAQMARDEWAVDRPGRRSNMSCAPAPSAMPAISRFMRSTDRRRAPACCYLSVVDSLPRAAFRPGTPVAEGGRATVDYVAAAIRLVA